MIKSFLLVFYERASVEIGATGETKKKGKVVRKISPLGLGFKSQRHNNYNSNPILGSHYFLPAR